MLIKKAAKIKSSEITDYSVWQQRRKFIKQAAALGAGAASWNLALSTSSAQADEIKGRPLQGMVKSDIGNKLEPTAFKHVTSYNNFYEFGTGKHDPADSSSALKTRPWTVRVSGECESPGEIGIEDILAGFTQEERIYRFRCVEAWAMVVPWAGFSLGDLLKKFKPTSKARYVAFETLFDPQQMPEQKRKVLDWPYREGLRMDEAMHPLTMLATGLYGIEMPNQNGAPLRLVVPWKYGFKSIKSIVGIRFMESMPFTTWSDMAANEYGFYANVNPDVNHPRWSQGYHRQLGGGIFARKQKTEMLNGYADEVAGLYTGMDLKKYY
jgi:sulfoxide reductase catalytic subunit YedY